MAAALKMGEPRVAEIEPRKKWTLRGMDCLILEGPFGALCGYVRITNSHPLYGVGYSTPICGVSGCYEHSPDGLFEVHGGITFSGERRGTTWWFGFDCGHAGDLIPALNRYGLTEGVYRDEAYVTDECEKLASQLRVFALSKPDISHKPGSVLPS